MIERANIPETAKKRRRWLWGIPVAVLLLMGGLYAWDFRPLNPTEQGLIGRWQQDDPAPRNQRSFHFTTDRRFHLTEFPGLEMRGDWFATGDVLTLRSHETLAPYARLRDPLIVRVGKFLKVKFRPAELHKPVRFFGPDRVTLDGENYARIPDETSPVADQSAAP